MLDGPRVAHSCCTTIIPLFKPERVTAETERGYYSTNTFFHDFMEGRKDFCSYMLWRVDKTFSYILWASKGSARREMNIAFINRTKCAGLKLSVLVYGAYF